MRRILVIGIGNLLQGDDGIGVKVISDLAKRLKEHGVAALVGETDVPFCLAEIMADDYLILIDAAATGGEAGRVDVIPLDEALRGREPFYAHHQYSLFDAIFLTYPRMRGCLITIEGASFGYDTMLSEPLQQHFEAICEAVFKKILEQKTKAARN